MALNCIWWWDSSSGTVENVDNPSFSLLPGPLLARVVVSAIATSMGQMLLLTAQSFTKDYSKFYACALIVCIW